VFHFFRLGLAERENMISLRVEHTIVSGNGLLIQEFLCENTISPSLDIFDPLSLVWDERIGEQQ
jgi:hypothetical protein